jgi:hypothetical protein
MVFLTASAQDVLQLSAATFRKWSKDFSNSGYPMTQSSADGNQEFSAKFMLNMENVFAVKVTPLSTFEKLSSKLEQSEIFEFNGLNAVYGFISSKSYLLLEIPENNIVMTFFTEHKLKRREMEDIASVVPYKRLK